MSLGASILITAVIAGGLGLFIGWLLGSRKRDVVALANSRDVSPLESELREQLKAGLSSSVSELDAESRPDVSEIARQIAALKAMHSTEATPERVGKHRARAEEPVTARIRSRNHAI